LKNATARHRKTAKTSRTDFGSAGAPGHAGAVEVQCFHVDEYFIAYDNFSLVGEIRQPYFAKSLTVFGHSANPPKKTIFTP